ncbi:MAG: hypothetical protein ABJF23_27055 [Bryobacteraceae bacterium]
MANTTSHHVVLRDGQFEAPDGAASLDALFLEAKQSAQKDKLLIHFHGGLVDMASGAHQAEVLKPAFLAAGAFPIFVLWQSGFHDVVENKIPTVLQEPLVNHIVRKLLQFLVPRHARDQREGAMATENWDADPALIDQQLEKARPFEGEEFALVRPAEEQLTEDDRAELRFLIETDPGLAEEASALANFLDAAASAGSMSGGTAEKRVTLMDREVIDEWRREAVRQGQTMGAATFFFGKKAFEAAVQITKRFFGHTDHGLYLTTLEEVLRAFYFGRVGGTVWQTMKNSINAAFSTSSSGAATLVELLHKHLAGGYRPSRIILTAHSAGSIYVCDFLRYAATRLAPDIAFDVIFVAPACTFEKFAETIRSFQPRVRNFRLFGMSDELEREDVMVEVAGLRYNGSLLYFVAGLLEPQADTPLAGMERYYSGQRPYQGPVYKIVSDLVTSDVVWSKLQPGNILLTVSGPPGKSCGLRTHGGFYEDHDTVRSLQHLIRNGF